MKRPNKLSSLTSTQQESYKMFSDKNMSIEDIAKERFLKPTTVIGHLADALEAGYFVDYRRGIVHHSSWNSLCFVDSQQ